MRLERIEPAEPIFRKQIWYRSHLQAIALPEIHLFLILRPAPVAVASLQKIRRDCLLKAPGL